MKQYETFELSFAGAAPTGSEALAGVEAVFSHDGKERRVKGFYDGDGVYKVRFLPEACGVYTWEVTGAVSGRGREECIPGDAHGLVKAEGCHFRYADGAPYAPFGTTVYALIHQEQALIEKTMDSLAHAPFNKLRHCVFPKSYEFNRNEPRDFPFRKNTEGKWDVHRPDHGFWRRLEANILRLGGMGIQSDLILFHPYDRWGFSALTMEESEVYLRYALRRLAAIPCIWWSMANEYDLCFSKKTGDWYQIEEIIRSEDPYGHLLSNHYCMKFYDYARDNLTHCSMQNILFYKAAQWMEQYHKPVVYDECCYEGDIPNSWGNISAKEMVHRFWCAYSTGAYATHGETYLSPDDVLWWSKGGTLKGESPSRIAFLRQLIEELPGALECWREPTELLGAPDFIGTEPGQDTPFFAYLESLTQAERDAAALKDKVYSGCCGEDAFLKYYGRQQPARSCIILPEEHSYTVELIDTWNCTRETILSGASGIAWFDLPGREGMAVLAKQKKPAVQ